MRISGYNSPAFGGKNFASSELSRRIRGGDSANMAPGSMMGGADAFKFPFTPYAVQLQLMTAVYDALSGGKVGIFESPTGTGKSLSIICSSLRWLQENPVYVNPDDQEANVAPEDEDLPAWVIEHVKKRADQRHAEAEQSERERLERARARMAEQSKERRAKVGRPGGSGVFVIGGGGGSERKGGGGKAAAGKLPWEGEDGEDRILLSDDDEGEAKQRDKIKAAMKELWGEDSDEDEAARRRKEEEEEMDVRKVIYTSRTHTQLSQFMGEVRRTAWGTGLKAVALAGRNSMCIHEKVSKLKTSTRVNAACLDLMRGKDKGGEDDQSSASDAPSVLRGVYAPSSKKGGKKKGGCPFYDDLKRLDLRDTILAEVQDIEEVVAQGKATSACAYYASRAAVKSSELVCVPYTSLVHKGTREALGVSLEGNVVVIDEAHNLIDAVNEVHSASLTQASAKVLIKLFQGYLNKFLTRLSPANVVRLKQVVWVLKSFEGLMSKASSAAPEPANVGSQKKQQTAQAAAAAAPPPAAAEAAADKLDEGDANKIKARVGSVLSVAEFCVATKIDNINLFDLLRYFEKSKILPKLHGYYERMQMTEGSGEETGGLADGQVSVVQPFQTFLRCLTDQEDDGRITLHRDESSGAVRMSYQLLNAATHFSDIVSKAHAVVLVGGTMKPMEDFAQQLFPTVSVERLMTLSVDHVIEDSNILPLTLSEGPTGQVFDFRHEARGSDRIVDELGRTVLNLCCVVPDGVVLFLPSYTYEELVYKRWKASGILDKIDAKKKFLREPRGSGEVDAVLEEYAKHISANLPPEGGGPRGRTGSVLVCVVGGKLSEGINFSDGLGRCVVVAGLPFPNAADPGLKEKIRYIQSLPAPPSLGDTAAGKTLSGVAAGQAYYQNLCMKAVNQCIGRAIRHVNDYAAIVLVDQRYSTPGVRSKIAGWISRRIRTDLPTKFGPSYSRLAEFFRGKKHLQDKVEETRRRSNELASGCQGMRAGEAGGGGGGGCGSGGCGGGVSPPTAKKADGAGGGGAGGGGLKRRLD